MKTMTTLFLAALVGGCATGNPDYQAGNHSHNGEYVNLDRDGKQNRIGVRVAPCSPFYADELIEWAKGAEGGRIYHERDVRASVTPQGWVNCSSRESAGSGSRGR